MPITLTTSNRKKRFWFFMLLFLIPISGLSIDIYIPSLPAMNQFFHTSKALIQMSITLYMFSMGVIQIIAGPISDSFGRKKPFVIGMLIYILAVVVIPFTSNIYILLSMRLLQGIAVGLFVVPVRAIITDLFTGKELHKAMSYMVTAWSIGPIIAPFIGGYLQDHFGWQANFWFLTLYSIIGFLIVICFIPETSAHRHDFSLKIIFSNGREILSSWEYDRGLLTNGLLYSIVILFAIVAPFLLQNQLHLSAIQFGHVALFIGVAWFFGSLINRFTIHVVPLRKITIALKIILAINIVMLFIAYFLPLNLYSFMIPLFFLVMVSGVVFPTYFANAIALFPKKSASAGAFMGAATFFIPSIISACGTLLKSSTALPLVCAYLVIVGVCLVLTKIRK